MKNVKEVESESCRLFQLVLRIKSAIVPLREASRDPQERASMRHSLRVVVHELDGVAEAIEEEAEVALSVETARELTKIHEQEDKEDADANAG